MWPLLLLTAASAETPPAPPPPPKPINADRVWQILPAPGEDLRPTFRLAGEKLGDWTILLGDHELNGPKLVALADRAPDEPFLRALREEIRLPVDPIDLLYFLDDVLVAGERGRRGERFVVGTGRARSNGILLHPWDVFETNKPRNYPEKPKLPIDEPPPQESFPPAADGELLGPNWTMRYRSPTTLHDMYVTLAQKRGPADTFTSRVASLLVQMELAGADVYPNSFLRYRERGYLMWGSHLLRMCTTSAGVSKALARLEKANRVWAHVPIKWRNPKGWQATRESARQMADAFGVVYATEFGARHSNHYDGTAVDFVVTGLPRRLELWAPDGAHEVFDLSGPDETRDLSLSPVLIDWIEAHFEIEKLNSDHPHWDDKNAPEDEGDED